MIMATSTSEEFAAAQDRKPAPRHPKSPARMAQIRAQNRRREYLRQNPDYYKDLEHEFADPVMYEALIRRFQNPAEREAEGLVKGYSRILEGDLLRGEAKLQELSKQAAAQNGETATAALGNSNGCEPPVAGLPDWAGLDEKPSAEDKEEGRQQWNEFLTERFVKGEDPDFEYGPVDANDDLDTLEKQEAEEAWFEDEDPSWANDEEDSSPCERALQGETGIQDF